MKGITNAGSGGANGVTVKIKNVPSGATVTLTGPKTYSATGTGADVVFKGVPSGTYTMTLVYGTMTLTDTITVISEIEVNPVKIVSWADGTDQEISNMLQAHYLGMIDIHDYWTVGDERTVSLGAIASSGTANGVSWSVSESHSAQNVTLVLMHSGLYDLVEGGKCAFVVGQKNGLLTSGYMNNTAANAGSWDSSKRRPWCNGGYWNAIPSTLRSIFKQFKTITAREYNSSDVKVSNDYFALFAEKEIFGARAYSNATEADALTQIDYYKTTANRIKKVGDSGSANSWWERSPYSSGSYSFCFIYSEGSVGYYGASNASLLSPFGCI